MGIPCQSLPCQAHEDIVFQDGEYLVLRGPCGMLEQNNLSFCDPGELAQQIEWLKKRQMLNGIRIPQLYRFSTDKCHCHGEFTLKVTIEQTTTRLSQLSKLNLGDAKYVLTTLLQTDHALSQHYHYNFTPHKAALTPSNKLVLWVHDNFFRSEPVAHQSVSSGQTQRAINRQTIVRCVMGLCPGRQFQWFVREVLNGTGLSVGMAVQEVVRNKRRRRESRKQVSIGRAFKDRLMQQYTQEITVSLSRHMHTELD